mmetsp:Transcript_7521/g.11404  ORF Transcript_7521/g.11404 Transcript_7521/m.11404 type:complete len:382 (-) Transcript_7521:116-1261(-)|eukprot:CAMPEP_0113935808 /NCGR_PEP_ID=MMETSP1339-20121228/2877_1 /TAXON_ID=94617 /ORGANISM="Fibrocapsa japonica" /LENGTH=381 /DNA_ID=CAMNT_0000938077 /DNA_START=47 /DNA_END=1192 /DNA_ORIENTATION=- /assembly_acc=CAM_ASM_000762
MKISWIKKAFVLLCCASAASGAWFGTDEPTFEDVENKLHLDEVEKWVGKAWDVLQHPSDLAKLGFGSALLLYSRHFSYLVLHMQAWRIAGWPEFKDTVAELGDTYSRTRQVLKEEYPTLMKSKELLEAKQDNFASLKDNLESVKAAMKNPEAADAESLKLKSKEIAAQMKDAQAEMETIEAGMSSINAITKSVDADKLKGLCKGVYMGFLQSYAVAKSPIWGQVSTGINIGDIVSRSMKQIEDVEHLVLEKVEAATDKHVPVVYSKWAKNSLKAVAALGGVAASILLQNAAMTVSASLYGGMILSDLIEKRLDPYLEEHGIETIAEDEKKKHMLQWGLTGTGLFLQLKKGGLSHQNFFARMLLFPFTFADRRLRALGKKAD